MPRYKLIVEYNGTGLVGWQKQDNGLSVQEMLEDAAFALTGEMRRFSAAGRTDAGVHALGQAVHFDTQKDYATERVQDAMNYWLRLQAEEAERPHQVSVVGVEAVPDSFHARFSATSRHYLYRIAARRPPPVMDVPFVWWCSRPLDHEAMHDAAQILVGHHDFTTFRATECQASTPFKTLDYLTVERIGEEIHVRAGARSFLHHQVRNFVGALSLVGFGRWGKDELKAALEAKNRTKGGPTAPPSGLFLTKVGYGES